MSEFSEIIRNLLRPRVDSIIMLDEYLHTQPYNVNEALPGAEIGNEVN